jgi:phospholipase/carboxylesterase
MATSSPRPHIPFRDCLTTTSSVALAEGRRDRWPAAPQSHVSQRRVAPRAAMPRNRPSGLDRLHARPAPAPSAGVAAGTSQLDGGALLRVPPAAATAAPLPLVVFFHGAGSSAGAALGLLASVADDAGLVLLAPQARASTWDVIRGGFGPDVARLDAQLVEVFATCRIDAAHIALGGFSDGASYAASLGLGNGDLVTHVLAFSPGFAAPAARRGRPRLFVTHGTADAVLPIDRCSRVLVPRLRREGYDVVYIEFDGGHEVPAALGRCSVDWLLHRRGEDTG